MSVIRRALYLTTSGVLFRLNYPPAPGPPTITPETEESGSATEEQREVRRVVQLAGEDDRFTTEQFRIVRRVYPDHWLKVITESSREIRLAHLDKAVRRWDRCVLSTLPKSAQPADYARLIARFGAYPIADPLMFATTINSAVFSTAAQEELNGFLETHFYRERNLRERVGMTSTAKRVTRLVLDHQRQHLIGIF